MEGIDKEDDQKRLGNVRNHVSVTRLLAISCSYDDIFDTFNWQKGDAEQRGCTMVCEVCAFSFMDLYLSKAETRRRLVEH